MICDVTEEKEVWEFRGQNRKEGREEKRSETERIEKGEGERKERENSGIYDWQFVVRCQRPLHTHNTQHVERIQSYSLD